jgi:hypothetical protein
VFDGSEIEGKEGRLLENAMNVMYGTAVFFISWVYFVPRSAARILTCVMTINTTSEPQMHSFSLLGHEQFHQSVFPECFTQIFVLLNPSTLFLATICTRQHMHIQTVSST